MSPDDMAAGSGAGTADRPSAAAAQVQLHRRASYAATRWKNGGGVTHEALRVPAGGATYLWRVSVAEIAESGPFSDFTGYQRRLVLLAGSGLRLEFSNGERALLQHAGELIAFDGALGARCELLAGPCTDLNLVAANSLRIVEAAVRSLAQPLRLLRRPGETILLFNVGGPVTIELDDGETATLGNWDSAVIRPAGGTAVVRSSAERQSNAAVFLAKLADS